MTVILPRSCKKNGTLALCDQKKKKNNKPTKKKILGGPFMYHLKNNNKKRYAICIQLHTMYIYLPVDTTLEEKPQKFYHAFEED